MASTLLALLFLCLNSSFILSSTIEENTDELISVAVLFRHGDRAPKDSFPTDVYYNTSYWPFGFSQLTNAGKNHHYDLGKWFRSRYTDFLPEKYSPGDIYVRSSDVDRTLMSAAVNLAGLYPPNNLQRWNSEMPWQPIPIHTVAKKKDTIISMKKKCKKYKKKLAELDDDKFFKNINKEHSDLFEYLSNQTGWEVDDISYINDLQDIFYTYGAQNPAYVPSWAESLDQNVMTYLSGLAAVKATYTDELKQLLVGPFFDFLITRFEGVIDNDGTEKFLMLSGHEHTLVAILNSIGAYDYLTPEFASTIIWEVRKTEDGAYYVNIFYKKEKEMTEITLAGCTFNCEFKQFKKSLAPITLNEDEWDDAC